MTDSITYLLDGTVMATNLTKASVSATLPAVISCPGPAGFHRLFTDRMEREFETFDDLIGRGEAWIAKTFLELAEEQKAGDAMSTLYVIGWHARENRPGGYVVDLWTDGSSQKSQVFSESDAEAVAETIVTRWKLQEIRPGYLNGTPMPSPEQCEVAGFELRDADEYDPAIDLLHLTEIARQQLDDNNLSWVGGKAFLTTIDERDLSAAGPPLDRRCCWLAN